MPKGGDYLTLAARGLKRCCRCRHLLPREEFWKSTIAWDGLQTSCKTCRSNPAFRRDSHLRFSHGITTAEYNSMLGAQCGLCAICDQPGDIDRGGRLRVDHCHTVGRIRQLLCNPCNLALGMFKDSPVSMRRAADYIEEMA